MLANNPALIIVDMQRAMSAPTSGRRNNPGAETNISSLLLAWRKAHYPVIHVRHVSSTSGSPFAPDQIGVEFQPQFAPNPGEHTVEKNVPDAFIHTGLEHWLRVRSIGRLVIVGVSTNISIESTARTASNLGFSVTVVSDATFAFEKTDFNGVARAPEEVHAMSLANLGGEFATLAYTSEVISAL